MNTVPMGDFTGYTLTNALTSGAYEQMSLVFFASGPGVLMIEWYDGEHHNSSGFDTSRIVLSTFRKLTNSKTYTNTKYGYSFSYPDGDQIDDGSPELVIIRPAGSSFAPLPTVKVVRQSATAYVDSLLSEDSQTRKASDQIITVAGQSARRVVIATSVGLNFEHTVLQRDGYVIDVLGLENDAVVAGIRDSLAIGTTSWPTYRNSSAGYSLRYPTSWVHFSEAKGTVETFAPITMPTGSCFFKADSQGLLGRDTTLTRGPDEPISVAGVKTTEHTWTDTQGALAYFNLEVRKGSVLLGFEGSAGSDTPNCSATLTDILASVAIP